MYTTLIDQFNLQPHTATELCNTYRAQFGRLRCEKRQVSQVISTIRGSGYQTGIVSNDKSPFKGDKLADLKLTDEFDTVVASEATGVRKPDPAIFHLACKNPGVHPTETIFVSDNPAANIATLKVQKRRDCLSSLYRHVGTRVPMLFAAI